MQNRFRRFFGSFEPTSNYPLNVAIIGATGAVGQEMLKVLEQRRFPVKEIRCFASPQSAGKTVQFKGRQVPIEKLSENCFQGIDIALFSAGKKISLVYAPLAVKAGCLVVDNSSAYRMDPHVPLVIPEINSHALENHSGIVSSPNCTATVMLMVLSPLHRQFKIRRIVMSTYQAASGAGQKAMTELQEESRAILENRPFTRTAMPFPYAFNLFAHNAPMTASCYNEEELKVIEEARKILEEPALRIAVTCVRVPVLRAHCEALNVEFENPITAQEAKAILQKSPGVTVLEDWDQNRFPMPLDASGQDSVFVGRIRHDLSNPNTLDLWAAGDQLLKGAALNAVQIAEKLYSKNVPWVSSRN
ncbi:MAG TPA: aspartate-semialdehyde dehydrogenase [Rhabdochlamydiaceae bacterium]|nr:aspartate-semialdehyde dehydrogenase [Rhabdochlamydiaceae bacterium]